MLQIAEVPDPKNAGKYFEFSSAMIYHKLSTDLKLQNSVILMYKKATVVLTVLLYACACVCLCVRARMCVCLCV